MMNVLELKSLPVEIVDELHLTEKDEYSFEWYDKKQFKKLLSYYDEKGIETEGFVIGNVSLNDKVDLDELTDDEKDEITILHLGEEVYLRVTEPDDSVDTYGYVRVGKQEYIRIEEGGAAAIIIKGGKFGKWFKRFGKFIILTLLLSSLVAWFNYQGYSVEGIVNRILHGGKQIEDNSGKGIDDEQQIWDGTLQTGGENSTNTGLSYIDVAGYANLYVSEENPNIKLINLGTSMECYLVYKITLDGEVIYETDLIKPQQEINWNAYETLKGLGLENATYWLGFDLSHYVIQEDGTAGESLNGVTQKVDITLK